MEKLNIDSIHAATPRRDIWANKIKIVKMNEDAILPKYETSQSAGMDLRAYIEKEITIRPSESAIIPTRLKIQLPDNYEMQIRPRSGLAAKNKITILNAPGTIDADYRGEIKIILINHGKNDFVINHNDRIAQAVIHRVDKLNFEEVDRLDTTERNEGGFGSTGK